MSFSAGRKFENSLILRFSVFFMRWQQYPCTCIKCKRLLRHVAITVSCFMDF